MGEMLPENDQPTPAALLPDPQANAGKTDEERRAEERAREAERVIERAA